MPQQGIRIDTRIVSINDNENRAKALRHAWGVAQCSVPPLQVVPGEFVARSQHCARQIRKMAQWSVSQS
jgi:hypothetical protein